MASTDKSKQLSQPPNRQAMTDADGTPTTPWALFFQQMFTRVGGGYSDTVGDLSGKVSDLTTRTAALEASVNALEPKVATLQDQMSTVQTQVADLETRVLAIEDLLATGVNGTITTAALSVGGSEGSMTFSKGLLIAQVQAT